MVCHEDIGITYFIIIKSTFSLPLNLANAIKHHFYPWWRMLMIDLHYARTFFNPYLFEFNVSQTNYTSA
jgi:hypothetical protein